MQEGRIAARCLVSRRQPLSRKNYFRNLKTNKRLSIKELPIIYSGKIKRTRGNVLEKINNKCINRSISIGKMGADMLAPTRLHVVFVIY